MEAIKEKTMLEKLTLGFAAVLTLVQLAVLMDCFTLTNLLWLLAAGALTWLLLRGGKEEYFWYAFLGVGAAALIGFFAGFSRELYAIVTVRGEYRNAAENFFTVLPGLLYLAGSLGVTALGGLLFASKFPAVGDKLRRLWYLPALLFAVGPYRDALRLRKPLGGLFGVCKSQDPALGRLRVLPRPARRGP